MQELINKIHYADCLEISDLQIGKAGEYLVCADLILKGHVAFPSEQGLPYDVILAANDRLYKVQVKTTRKPMAVPQRVTSVEKYLFHIKRCGKGGHLSYGTTDVDIFAVVALDTKVVGYLNASQVKRTMHFLPEDKSHLRYGLCKRISQHRLEDVLTEISNGI